MQVSSLSAPGPRRGAAARAVQRRGRVPRVGHIPGRRPQRCIAQERVCVASAAFRRSSRGCEPHCHCPVGDGPASGHDGRAAGGAAAALRALRRRCLRLEVAVRPLNVQKPCFAGPLPCLPLEDVNLFYSPCCNPLLTVCTARWAVGVADELQHSIHTCECMLSPCATRP